MKKIAAVLIWLIFAVPSQARIITVDDDGPADFNNIQAAINDSNDGDTVEVYPGTYTGSGNRDIDFLGKAITVRSIDPNDPNIVAATIIDCNGTETEYHRGFYFHSEEEEDSILSGFTIIKGYASSGGAIFCYNSTPTIMNCNITNNTASDSGGGIYCKLTLPPLPPPPIQPPVQDCNSTGPTIANCKITGNTASSASGSGGGIYYENSGPIILNCTITSNTAQSGGGIYSTGELLSPAPPPPPPAGEAAEEQSSAEDLSEFTSNLPTISHCIITNNTVSGIGGGICNHLKSQQIITHCIISGNLAEFEGGGIYNSENHTTINNCVISYNRTDEIAGGIFNWNAETTIYNCTIINNSNCAISNVDGSDSVFIKNCILWGHECEIALLPNYIFPTPTESKASVSYCDVMGGETGVFVGMDCTLDWGQGNIDLDPCLANPGYWADKNDPNIIVEPDDPNAVLVVGDYHLKSQAGRWNADSENWVRDDVTSPCIDTGEPNSFWRRELWPHGERINMGAYGGTPEASMSLSGAGNIADLNFDGFVGYADVNIFTDKWLYRELLLPEDLNRDGLVNFPDFSILAYNWEPPPPLPGQAGNPEPADGATDVNLATILSWTAGSYAASHDVYFGTSNPPPFVCNQTSTTFDPFPLSYGMTYYWRIDEINVTGTTVGTTWTFTTVSPPTPAVNPNPFDGATGVDLEADLSWTAGFGATSHDVYFGTSNPPPFIGNQTSTTYDPGTMAPDDWHYWRIDEVNKWGITIGEVWSFTTMPPPPP